MMEITSQQIERVNLLLSSIPKGAEKVFTSSINRAKVAVRKEVTKQIRNIYAINQKDIRSETNITMNTKKSENGIIGTVSFAGFKIPLYRFNTVPKSPRQGATVKAAVLRSNSQTAFAHAFIARMKSGHIGMFERDTSKRTPITEFMGPSTAQMAHNSVVVENVEAVAQDTVNKRIEHEISRILSGYI